MTLLVVAALAAEPEPEPESEPGSEAESLPESQVLTEEFLSRVQGCRANPPGPVLIVEAPEPPALPEPVYVERREVLVVPDHTPVCVEGSEEPTWAELRSVLAGSDCSEWAGESWTRASMDALGVRSVDEALRWTTRDMSQAPLVVIDGAPVHR